MSRPTGKVANVLLLTPLNPYSKKGGRTIVIAERRYRSKWWTLICFCNRERKDGTCKTLDNVIPIHDRVHFEHKPRGGS